MHSKKVLIYITIFIFIVFPCFCQEESYDNIPSAQEVAQFNLDVSRNNVEAVRKTIEKYPNIINIGYEIPGLGTVFPVHTYVLTSSNLEIG